MATVTITTTAAQDARLAPAFGDFLQLGQNATVADVKAALVTFMQQVVRRYEAAQLAATVGPDITPT